MTTWTSTDTDRFIKEVQLFETLDEQAHMKLAQRAEVRNFTAGKAVISRGETGSSLFVVAQGEVRVTLEGPKGNQEVSILKVGDFFGEIAMMTQARRTATVTTQADTLVLEFAAAAILPLLEQFPDFKKHIARTGVQRSCESLEKMIED